MTEVQIDAWPGESARGVVPEGAQGWGARRGGMVPAQKVLLSTPVDPTDWRSPDVGYGLLVPDVDGVPDADKAAGRDLPECLWELLRARPGAVVLRSRGTPGYLRRYYADGAPQDCAVGLSPWGVARGHLPRYVAIVGGPAEVPWSLQYALAVRHCVGRLPLTGPALEHYVSALLDDWAGADCDVQAPVVWTVDHGPSDITALMRAALTAPLAKEFADPRLPRFTPLDDDAATAARLVATVADRRPALVVTSSHGSTAPLDEPARMAAQLGLPVDAAHVPVPLDGLVDAVPAGAVWFAQACCSVGSDAPSQFSDLLAPGSVARLVVDAVAGIGASVSPAVPALLGRERPARAVVGHVEPTFDLTLRLPTGQLLGHRVVEALSTNLHAGQPLGHALAPYWQEVGQLHARWADDRHVLDGGDGSVLPRMAETRLTALDRQSLVVMGDPTVRLPAVP